MAAWEDGYWWSKDGLRLHYRDYVGPARTKLLPIVCLPGLSRNARDFAPLAERLAAKRRVLVVELRGRGESAPSKDPSTYVPATYVEDLEALVAQRAIDRAILFGTSLGGILTMILAARHPGLVAGALLNDIGPQIESSGLSRIRGYIGRSGNYPTWLHAARSIAETQGGAYPDYELKDWLAMAKRLCRLTPAGRIVHDYDTALAEPFRTPGGEGGADLWPLLEGLKSLPSLLVRGGLSDILSAATADRMQAGLPLMERIEVPRTGHAPTLFEPECETAIDHLLARIDKAG